MLRLVLLGLILSAKLVSAEEELEGSADGDDEEDEEYDGSSGFIKNEASTAEGDGTTMIIIIAAVCVVALAIIAIIAVFLFRRHLKNREQGVYTVPAEQSQKTGV